MRQVTIALLCYCLVAPALPATEKVDTDIQAKIRKEGMDDSHIMHTMHFLTDVYGPRLTGSPSHKAAAEWAVKEMTSWGFKNAHLEPWDFGHPGWVNERQVAHIVSPVKDALVCEVLAWTPSTDGVLNAAVYQMIPPTRPTEEEFVKYLDGEKGKVKGKIVLAGAHTVVPFQETPPAKRRTDEQVKEQYGPGGGRGGFGRGGRGGQEQDPTKLTANQINARIDEFLVANGAKVRVNDAGREHGQIRAFNNRTYDPAKAPPTLVMRNEDYGRISRILADGTPVSLEVEIVNKWFPEGKTSYNTVAEIPGTDKKDEVVMLGGHLDSWHSATGATDNAIGCAVMMEAARIIQAIGSNRAGRFAWRLWSGEEEGLLGSAAYVAQHFGTVENPKPEFFKLDAYFNIDSGTGRARGASIFGPGDAATILREALAGFADLGFGGANATSSRATGGTDSTNFNHAGLPGVGMGQDPIEYQSHTWHTNLDTYERIVEGDAKTSAVIISAAILHLANRDEMVPRFPKETMPPLPAAPAARGTR
jgi:carboxypeptidase Q